MSSIRTYNQTQQLEIIRRFSKQGTLRVSALMLRKQADVIRMCEHRAMSIGIEEYGDSSFHLDLPSIEQATMEELADAVLYQIVYSAKERGIIQ
jgi:hypothetical protein